MATQVYTRTQTYYVQTIQAIDADNDSLIISPRNPAVQDNTIPMVGDSFSFVVAKPHSHVTGEAFNFTQTVETES